MSAAKYQKQAGFNLIELMVVLSIFAILAGVAVPSFMDFMRDSKARTQSNQILSNLHFARSEAIKRQTNVETKFNQLSGSWNLEIIRKDTNEVVRRLAVTDSMVGLTGDTTVIFDSRGRALLPKCVGIEIEEMSQYSRHINIQAGGKLSVEYGSCQTVASI